MKKIILLHIFSFVGLSLQYNVNRDHESGELKSVTRISRLKIHEELEDEVPMPGTLANQKVFFLGNQVTMSELVQLVKTNVYKVVINYNGNKIRMRVVVGLIKKYALKFGVSEEELKQYLPEFAVEYLSYDSNGGIEYVIEILNQLTKDDYDYTIIIEEKKFTIPELKKILGMNDYFDNIEINGNSITIATLLTLIIEAMEKIDILEIDQLCSGNSNEIPQILANQQVAFYGKTVTLSFLIELIRQNTGKTIITYNGNSIRIRIVVTLVKKHALKVGISEEDLKMYLPEFAVQYLSYDPNGDSEYVLKMLVEMSQDSYDYTIIIEQKEFTIQELQTIIRSKGANESIQINGRPILIKIVLKLIIAGMEDIDKNEVDKLEIESRSNIPNNQPRIPEELSNKQVSFLGNQVSILDLLKLIEQNTDKTVIHYNGKPIRIRLIMRLIKKHAQVQEEELNTYLPNIALRYLSYDINGDSEYVLNKLEEMLYDDNEYSIIINDKEFTITDLQKIIKRNKSIEINGDSITMHNLLKHIIQAIDNIDNEEVNKLEDEKTTKIPGNNIPGNINIPKEFSDQQVSFFGNQVSISDLLELIQQNTNKPVIHYNGKPVRLRIIARLIQKYAQKAEVAEENLNTYLPNTALQYLSYDINGDSEYVLNKLEEMLYDDNKYLIIINDKEFTITEIQEIIRRNKSIEINGETISMHNLLRHIIQAIDNIDNEEVNKLEDENTKKIPANINMPFSTPIMPKEFSDQQVSFFGNQVSISDLLELMQQNTNKPVIHYNGKPVRLRIIARLIKKYAQKSKVTEENLNTYLPNTALQYLGYDINGDSEYVLNKLGEMLYDDNEYSIIINNKEFTIRDLQKIIRANKSIEINGDSITMHNLLNHIIQAIDNIDSEEVNKLEDENTKKIPANINMPLSTPVMPNEFSDQQVLFFGNQVSISDLLDLIQQNTNKPVIHYNGKPVRLRIIARLIKKYAQKSKVTEEILNTYLPNTALQYLGYDINGDSEYVLNKLEEMLYDDNEYSIIINNKEFTIKDLQKIIKRNKSIEINGDSITMHNLLKHIIQAIDKIDNEEVNKLEDEKTTKIPGNNIPGNINMPKEFSDQQVSFFGNQVSISDLLELIQQNTNKPVIHYNGKPVRLRIIARLIKKYAQKSKVTEENLNTYLPNTALQYLSYDINGDSEYVLNKLEEMLYDNNEYSIIINDKEFTIPDLQKIIRTNKSIEINGNSITMHNLLRHIIHAIDNIDSEEVNKLEDENTTKIPGNMNMPSRMSIMPKELSDQQISFFGNQVSILDLLELIQQNTNNPVIHYNGKAVRLRIIAKLIKKYAQKAKVPEENLNSYLPNTALQYLSYDINGDSEYVLNKLEEMLYDNNEYSIIINDKEFTITDLQKIIRRNKSIEINGESITMHNLLRNVIQAIDNIDSEEVNKLEDENTKKIPANINMPLSTPIIPKEFSDQQVSFFGNQVSISDLLELIQQNTNKPVIHYNGKPVRLRIIARLIQKYAQKAEVAEENLNTYLPNTALQYLSYDINGDSEYVLNKLEEMLYDDNKYSIIINDKEFTITDLQEIIRRNKSIEINGDTITMHTLLKHIIQAIDNIDNEQVNNLEDENTKNMQENTNMPPSTHIAMPRELSDQQVFFLGNQVSISDLLKLFQQNTNNPVIQYNGKPVRLRIIARLIQKYAQKAKVSEENLNTYLPNTALQYLSYDINGDSEYVLNKLEEMLYDDNEYLITINDKEFSIADLQKIIRRNKSIEINGYSITMHSLLRNIIQAIDNIDNEEVNKLEDENRTKITGNINFASRMSIIPKELSDQQISFFGNQVSISDLLELIQQNTNKPFIHYNGKPVRLRIIAKLIKKYAQKAKVPEEDLNTYLPNTALQYLSYDINGDSEYVLSKLEEMLYDDNEYSIIINDKEFTITDLQKIIKTNKSIEINGDSISMHNLLRHIIQAIDNIDNDEVNKLEDENTKNLQENPNMPTKTHFAMPRELSNLQVFFLGNQASISDLLKLITENTEKHVIDYNGKPVRKRIIVKLIKKHALNAGVLEDELKKYFPEFAQTYLDYDENGDSEYVSQLLDEISKDDDDNFIIISDKKFAIPELQVIIRSNKKPTDNIAINENIITIKDLLRLVVHAIDNIDSDEVNKLEDENTKIFTSTSTMPRQLSDQQVSFLGNQASISDLLKLITENDEKHVIDYKGKPVRKRIIVKLIKKHALNAGVLEDELKKYLPEFAQTYLDYDENGDSEYVSQLLEEMSKDDSDNFIIISDKKFTIPELQVIIEKNKTPTNSIAINENIITIKDLLRLVVHAIDNIDSDEVNKLEDEHTKIFTSTSTMPRQLSDHQVSFLGNQASISDLLKLITENTEKHVIDYNGKPVRKRIIVKLIKKHALNAGVLEDELKKYFPEFAQTYLDYDENGDSEYVSQLLEEMSKDDNDNFIIISDKKFAIPELQVIISSNKKPTESIAINENIITIKDLLRLVVHAIDNIDNNEVNKLEDKNTTKFPANINMPLSTPIMPKEFSDQQVSFFGNQVSISDLLELIQQNTNKPVIHYNGKPVRLRIIARLIKKYAQKAKVPEENLNTYLPNTALQYLSYDINGDSEYVLNKLEEMLYDDNEYSIIINDKEFTITDLQKIIRTNKSIDINGDSITMHNLLKHIIQAIDNIDNEEVNNLEDKNIKILQENTNMPTNTHIAMPRELSDQQVFFLGNQASISDLLKLITENTEKHVIDYNGKPVRKRIIVKLIKKYALNAGVLEDELKKYFPEFAQTYLDYDENGDSEYVSQLLEEMSEDDSDNFIIISDKKFTIPELQVITRSNINPTDNIEINGNIFTINDLLRLVVHAIDTIDSDELNKLEDENTKIPPSTPIMPKELSDQQVSFYGNQVSISDLLKLITKNAEKHVIDYNGKPVRKRIIVKIIKKHALNAGVMEDELKKYFPEFAQIYLDYDENGDSEYVSQLLEEMSKDDDNSIIISDKKFTIPELQVIIKKNKKPTDSLVINENNITIKDLLRLVVHAIDNIDNDEVNKLEGGNTNIPQSTPIMPKELSDQQVLFLGNQVRISDLLELIKQNTEKHVINYNGKRIRIRIIVGLIKEHALQAGVAEENLRLYLPENLKQYLSYDENGEIQYLLDRLAEMLEDDNEYSIIINNKQFSVVDLMSLLSNNNADSSVVVNGNLLPIQTMIQFIIKAIDTIDQGEVNKLQDNNLLVESRNKFSDNKNKELFIARSGKLCDQQVSFFGNQVSISNLIDLIVQNPGANVIKYNGKPIRVEIIARIIKKFAQKAGFPEDILKEYLPIQSQKYLTYNKKGNSKYVLDKLTDLLKVGKNINIDIKGEKYKVSKLKKMIEITHPEVIMSINNNLVTLKNLIKMVLEAIDYIDNNEVDKLLNKNLPKTRIAIPEEVSKQQVSFFGNQVSISELLELIKQNSEKHVVHYNGKPVRLRIITRLIKKYVPEEDLNTYLPNTALQYLSYDENGDSEYVLQKLEEMSQDENDYVIIVNDKQFTISDLQQIIRSTDINDSVEINGNRIAMNTLLRLIIEAIDNIDDNEVDNLEVGSTNNSPNNMPEITNMPLSKELFDRQLFFFGNKVSISDLLELIKQNTNKHVIDYKGKPVRVRIIARLIKKHALQVGLPEEDIKMFLPEFLIQYISNDENVDLQYVMDRLAEISEDDIDYSIIISDKQFSISDLQTLLTNTDPNGAVVINGNPIPIQILLKLIIQAIDNIENIAVEKLDIEYKNVPVELSGLQVSFLGNQVSISNLIELIKTNPGASIINYNGKPIRLGIIARLIRKYAHEAGFSEENIKMSLPDFVTKYVFYEESVDKQYVLDRLEEMSQDDMDYSIIISDKQFSFPDLQMLLSNTDPNGAVVINGNPIPIQILLKLIIQAIDNIENNAVEKLDIEYRNVPVELSGLQVSFLGNQVSISNLIELIKTNPGASIINYNGKPIRLGIIARLIRKYAQEAGFSEEKIKMSLPDFVTKYVFYEEDVDKQYVLDRLEEMSQDGMDYSIIISDKQFSFPELQMLLSNTDPNGAVVINGNPIPIQILLKLIIQAIDNIENIAVEKLDIEYRNVPEELSGLQVSFLGNQVSISNLIELIKTNPGASIINYNGKPIRLGIIARLIKKYAQEAGFSEENIKMFLPDFVKKYVIYEEDVDKQYVLDRLEEMSQDDMDYSIIIDDKQFSLPELSKIIGDSLPNSNVLLNERPLPMNILLRLILQAIENIDSKAVDKLFIINA